MGSSGRRSAQVLQSSVCDDPQPSEHPRVLLDTEPDPRSMLVVEHLDPGAFGQLFPSTELLRGVDHARRLDLLLHSPDPYSVGSYHRLAPILEQAPEITEGARGPEVYRGFRPVSNSLGRLVEVDLPSMGRKGSEKKRGARTRRRRAGAYASLKSEVERRGTPVYLESTAWFCPPSGALTVQGLYNSLDPLYKFGTITRSTIHFPEVPNMVPSNAPTPRTKLTKMQTAKGLFLFAAFISFLLSVGLWFSGSQEAGLFVGIWVPSICSAGALIVSGGRNE
jgi:hypothetical protein